MIVMKLGDTGLAIRQIQERLIAHGFVVSTDSIFSPGMKTAVIAFQHAHGLVEDGIVGPLTKAALDALVSRVAMNSGETVLVHGLEMPAVRCWPLRMLKDGRKPTITSRHCSHEPTRPTHYGADLFYVYRADDPPMKVGDGGRTTRWWIPDETHAIAPADGIVERCGDSGTGKFAWVRHAGGLCTGNFHLSRLIVKIGQIVKMGDSLGIVGDNPRDNDARHLHGELYQGDPLHTYPHGTLDPELWWIGAQMLPAED